MSNNTPDYKNNLVFEPSLTWEKLIELVNPLYVDEDSFVIKLANGNHMTFMKDGDISYRLSILKVKASYEEMNLLAKILKA